MSVGKRIKAWRNERGLTQLELASNANISRSYLAGVETEKYNPSLETLESIARALNVDVATLLQNERAGGSIVSIYGEIDPEQDLAEDVKDIDRRLIEAWKLLTDADQEYFLAQIDAVLKLRGQ